MWHTDVVIGAGSNQYVRRPARPCVPAGSLMTQASVGAENSERRRCGSLWGGSCRAWVVAPSWSHGKHPLEGHKIAAAGSAGCPAGILELLSQDPSDVVRHAVAANRSCPTDILEQLGRGQPEYYVRFGLACNPSCPPSVLEQLSGDPHPEVQHWVASNQACPPGALEQLVRAGDLETARAAASNPGCPRYLRALWQLARDSTS